MVLSMMRVTVRTGGVVALAMMAAVASSCRSRLLAAGDSGTISLDAASAADGMVDGATEQREPRSLGEPCDHATECESGICAAARIGPHGICCSTACDGSCAWCDQSGTCVFVPAGERPVGPFDCTVDSATACYSDGYCDGAGSCRRTEAGYPCGMDWNGSACDGDDAVIRMCDGLGACITTSQRSCAPYRCRVASGHCLAGCATDDDCAGVPCQPDGRCGFSSDADGAVD